MQTFTFEGISSTASGSRGKSIRRHVQKKKAIASKMDRKAHRDMPDRAAEADRRTHGQSVYETRTLHVTAPF